jgi:hypothetical protein
MKKAAFILITLSLIYFSSCKKMQDARITFFVTNAGDAGKWGSITVKIGSLSQQFLTPERRNMGLGECGEAENATTFYLPAGTYSYTADNGRWSGSVTVDNGDCQLVVLKY